MDAMKQCAICVPSFMTVMWVTYHYRGSLRVCSSQMSPTRYIKYLNVIIIWIRFVPRLRNSFYEWRYYMLSLSSLECIPCDEKCIHLYRLGHLFLCWIGNEWIVLDKSHRSGKSMPRLLFTPCSSEARGGIYEFCNSRKLSWIEMERAIWMNHDCPLSCRRARS